MARKSGTIFIASMQRVFPDRPIVEIDSKDPIFHDDLRPGRPIPGARRAVHPLGAAHTSTTATPRTGAASTTSKGRLMVAICYNMDLGDSWEHADNPQYPQKFSALGIRIGVNYVAYAMTH